MVLRFTVLCVVASTLACAQEYRALISGQVTDPSGAGVAGAKIVAVNAATNISINTTAAADGRTSGWSLADSRRAPAGRRVLYVPILGRNGEGV